jgi:hypothetical protein
MGESVELDEIKTEKNGQAWPKYNLLLYAGVSLQNFVRTFINQI